MTQCPLLRHGEQTTIGIFPLGGIRADDALPSIVLFLLNRLIVISSSKRRLLQTTVALAAAVSFSAPSLAQDKTSIKVGVTGGPHAQIMEQVKKVAEKEGLKIQIVEFGDYVQPNAALAAGDLDANSYQHRP